jgi:hypothetical protein
LRFLAAREGSELTVFAPLLRGHGRKHFDVESITLDVIYVFEQMDKLGPGGLG